MTINLADNDPRISYVVAASATQSSFTVPFEFFEDADLNLYVDGTLKTLATHYTVSGGSGSTGTITMTTGNEVIGISGNSTVVVTRSIDLERTTDFQTSGPFAIAALNEELDKIVAIQADLKDSQDRSLQLTDFDADASLTLPDVNTRKGKLLAFNATTGAVEAGASIAGTNTVAGLSADIETLAGIEDGTVATNAVSGLAAISSDVTAAAAITSNITSVAGIASNVSAVAADATDIGTVATNIASVNTVATNIADVVTVANDLNEAISEIETAADDLNLVSSNIETVATNIANVNAVGAIDSDVTTVAGIQANVTTVAGNDANVTTVAGISSSVPTVAGVASNVTTVAGVASDVTTVAGISSDVSTVATNNTNVTSVAGDITNINTVAGDTTAINTVATNIADVNNFADTYFISATAPANPTQGDLWFDTDPASLVMKVYDGSGFVNAGSSVNGTSNRTTHTATAGQTSFAATYDAGFVDVYLNGVKLINGTDFTATSGSSVVLATGAALNDTVDIVGYGTFELQNTSLDDLSDVSSASASTGQFLKWNGTNWVGDTVTIPSTDLVNDTTPQLGGALDAQSNNITSVGQLAIGTATPAKPLTVEGGSDYNMALRSASNRSGLAIHAPGTGTLGSPLASVTVLGSDNSFRLGTQTYYNLIMNQSGHVTTPNQPAFRVNANVSQTLGTGWQTVGYGTSLTQRGSAYNASTFIFTAPTAGWYQFSASWTATNNADTDGTFALSINGSHSNLINSVSMPNTGINYEGHSVAGCAYLAVGDNVKVVRYSSVTTTTRTSVYYGGWFTGFFIG